MQSVVEGNSLTMTRIFDAPKELVWKAWTDPDMVKHWWGPQGFTAPNIKIDLQVGGKYFFSMHGSLADGTDMIHYHVGVFKEIVPSEKIVFTQCFSDKDGNMMSSSEMGMPEMPAETLITVMFEDTSDGKTKMTLRHDGMPAEFGDMASGGWGQSFDKMAQLVETK
jgi:uncharacterized protein YndB with AHSA1/START domain